MSQPKPRNPQDPRPRAFVVSAASGRIGGRVARGLLDAGHEVRVLGRDPSRLAPLVERGAVPFVGDVRDAALCQRAFAGAERALLIVRASFDRFLELPASQRSCVILKDVLGHATREIAELLALSVPAVEACLHRGRARLRAGRGAELPAVTPPHSPAALRYARLFDARDWDALRAQLADDVRLDLVGHSQRTGLADVGKYFSNYATLPGRWSVAPAWLEGREVLAFLADPADATAAYVIELGFAAPATGASPVTSIRDYRFVPYLLAEARIVRS